MSEAKFGGSALINTAREKISAKENIFVSRDQAVVEFYFLLP